MDARREAFAVAYGLNGGNARAAAMEAGYSASFAKSGAYSLVKVPEIAGLIAEVEETGLPPEHLIPAQVTQQKALEVLSAMALATPEHFMDEEGNFSLEKAGIYKYAVREIIIDEKADGLKKIRVKLWDRIRSLREIAAMGEEIGEVSGVGFQVSGEEAAGLGMPDPRLVQAALAKILGEGDRAAGNIDRKIEDRKIWGMDEECDEECDEEVLGDGSPILQGKDLPAHDSTHDSTHDDCGFSLEPGEKVDGIVGRTDRADEGKAASVRRQEAPPTDASPTDAPPTKLPRKERRKLELAERRAARKARKAGKR